MLTISNALAQLLEEGRANIAWLIRFDLDSGSTGLWTGEHTISVGGVSFAGISGNIEFDAVTSQSALATDQVSVRIGYLSSAVTTIVANEIWHQRPAYLIQAFIDDAGAVVDTITRFAGFLDDLELTDADGDTRVVTLTLESNNRELSRSTDRVRSDPDQRRVSSGDTFFAQAASSNANTQIYWGSKGAQEIPRKKGGFLARLFG